MNFGNYFRWRRTKSKWRILNGRWWIDSQYGGYTSEESLEGGSYCGHPPKGGGDEHEQQTAAVLHHINQENAEANPEAAADLKAKRSTTTTTIRSRIRNKSRIRTRTRIRIGTSNKT